MRTTCAPMVVVRVLLFDTSACVSQNVPVEVRDALFQMLDDQPLDSLSARDVMRQIAEATHIWDASATLPDAYVTLFEQFRILFEIGAANRRRVH